MKITVTILVLLTLSLPACNKTSQVTFEIQGDFAFPFSEATVVLENHNGNPANIYTRSTNTNTITFTDISHGTYTVSVRTTGEDYPEYTYPALTIKKARLQHTVSIALNPYREIVSLGGIEWIVLERQKNRTLLITPRTIGEKRFDERNNIWDNSEIRKFLNEEFFDIFTNAEKRRITEHITGDKVFLLSEEEVKQYFISERDRVVRDSQGQFSWWWLRSSGDSGDGATVVDYNGDILLISEYVNWYSFGVRPALWVNL
ncbi:MAG: DUF6273 domain-containing protein [Candidatus Cloacimonetes bacterium]|nr:DUF6273 domain-containing protein [Candidatus Cloacimonadota bacterium]